jgi:hypothetical protein
MFEQINMSDLSPSARREVDEAEAADTFGEVDERLDREATSRYPKDSDRGY